MSNVSSQAGLDRIFTNPLLRDQASASAGNQTSVGSGVNGGGPAPDAARQGGGQAAGPSANARMSLLVFTSPGGANVDTEVLLVQVAVAMRDTEATSQKAKINTDQETKKAQAGERERKLEESQKKMAEAQEKKNNASVLDKIKLAFEWLGAALSLALGAVMIALGVTAAIGVALVAAAVVAIVMAIDSTVQMATGMGIAGNCQMLADKAANARGDNVPPLSDAEMKERAGKADMGFRISMAVIGIALAIVTGGKDLVNAVKNIGSAIGGAAQSAFQFARTAVGTATNSAATVAKVADAAQDVAGLTSTAAKLGKIADTGADVANIADDVAQTTQKATGFMAKLSDKAIGNIAKATGSTVEQATQRLQTAKTAVNAIEDVGQMSSAAVDMGTIGLRHEATTATADAKRTQAGALQDKAMMEMLDDMIDQALSRLVAANDRFNAILEGIVDAAQDRGNTLSRAQFRG